MAYSLNKLKEELVSKNLADDGLVAWGQATSNMLSLGGAVGGLLAGITGQKFAISMIENSKIAIFPFTNKEINYNDARAFGRDKLEKVKLSGLFTKTLKLYTVDGNCIKLPLLQGASSVKEIISRLGF